MLLFCCENFDVSTSKNFEILIELFLFNSLGVRKLSGAFGLDELFFLPLLSEKNVSEYAQVFILIRIVLVSLKIYLVGFS